MQSSAAEKRLVLLALVMVALVGVLLVRDELRDIRHRLDDLKANISAPAPVPTPQRPLLPSVRAPGVPDSSQLALPELKVESPDVLRIGFSPKLATLPEEDRYVVRQDGTITLGNLGTVSVIGATPRQIAETVRKSAVSLNPEVKVRVEIAGDHSQIFHVISDVVAGGAGETTTPFNLAGRTNVAEAVAKTGLKAASTWQVWIDRPAINGQAKILRVDWKALSQSAESATNYQLLPGDRLHIKSTE